MQNLEYGRRVQESRDAKVMKIKLEKKLVTVSTSDLCALYKREDFLDSASLNGFSRDKLNVWFFFSSAAAPSKGYLRNKGRGCRLSKSVFSISFTCAM